MKWEEEKAKDERRDDDGRSREKKRVCVKTFKCANVYDVQASPVCVCVYASVCLRRRSSEK